MRRVRSVVLIAICGAVLGLAACGDGGGGGDGGADADADSDTDADADADTDADTDTDADAGPLTDNPFIVSSMVFGLGTGTNMIVADHAVAGEGERCRVESVDGCTVIDCSPAAEGDPLPPTFTAGVVDLDRGDETLLSAQPMPESGAYDFGYEMTPLWSSGDLLAFDAAGADVPAFSQELTAPAPVSVIDPAGTFTISTADPLTVTWEPIEGDVAITVGQCAATATTALECRRFRCETDGLDGEFTVTPSVLAVLDPDPVGATTLNVGGSESMSLEVGGYNVQLWLTNAATFQVFVE